LTNAASGAGLLVVQVLVTFMVTPIFLGRLGTEAYGTWELVVAFVGNISLLELGFGQASIRGAANAVGRQSREGLISTVSNCFFMLTALGLLGMLIALAATPWADQILNVGSSFGRVATIVLLLGALQVLVRFVITACVSISYGLQMHAMVNGVRIVVLVISSSIAVFVIPSAPVAGLLWMALIAATSVLVQLLAIMYFLFREIGAAFSMKAVTLSTIKDFWAYGARSSVIQGAGTLMGNFTPFAVAHVIGTASVPFLTIANRLADYVYTLGSTLGMPLTPYLAEIDAKGTDAERFRSAYLSATRILMCFALGLPMGLVFFGPDALRLWLGESISSHAGSPLRVLCVALLAQGVATNAFRVLLVRNAHAPVAWTAAVGAVACSVLCWPLTAWFGVAGAAGAWLLYQIILATAELRTCCRIAGWSVPALLQETAGRYIGPLIILCIASVACRWISSPQTWFVLLAEVAIAGALYLAAVWVQALTSVERDALRRIVSRFTL